MFDSSFPLIAEGEIPPIFGGNLLNWIVVTLVGMLVYLVKRLVDNNQSILTSMKEESAQERRVHREDMSTVISEGKEYRQTIERGFDKIANAILTMERHSNHD